MDHGHFDLARLSPAERSGYNLIADTQGPEAIERVFRAIAATVRTLQVRGLDGPAIAQELGRLAHDTLVEGHANASTYTDYSRVIRAMTRQALEACVPGRPRPWS
jgi:hypothetical protein